MYPYPVTGPCGVTPNVTSEPRAAWVSAAVTAA
jgi:hypothetical protein